MSIYPTVRQLEIFVKVAQLRSFGRAASAVSLSQSALSQAVTQMEYLLDAKLFERTTRTVRLTAAGERFWPLAERLLSDYDHALAELNDAAGPRRGSVTIACIASLAYRFLPAVIVRFKTLYPQVSVTVCDDNTRGVLQCLRRAEADFAISTLVEEEAGLEFIPLLWDRFRLVCRRDDPLAARTRVNWADIAGRNLVALAPGTGTRALLERAMASLAPAPAALYEVSHLSTVLGMVEEGVGIALLPALAAPGDQHGLLCHRAIGEPDIKRVVGVIQPSDRALSPAATVFRDTLIDLLVQRGLPKLPDVTVLCRKAPLKRTPRKAA